MNGQWDATYDRGENRFLPCVTRVAGLSIL
jgi:hypothetical protein